MAENNKDSKPLLKVINLRSYIPTTYGVIKGVDGVDFSIYSAEAFGIAGESGCGKSMMALAIMGLAPTFAHRIVQGQIMYKGKNLLECSPKEMSEIRGKEIAMIFQEPMTSLNPTLSIGLQLREIVMRHNKLNFQEANKKATELLDMVRISSPYKMLSRYPHQLSGGMRQRVMIAMALSCRPEILIADEPTTALDVTIQAQIMDLIEDLQKEVRTSAILITHNLGLLAQFARRIIVMYLGRVLETGTIYDIFDSPKHPYTQGLLNAVPKIGRRSKFGKSRLMEIEGTVPNPIMAPPGCKFHPRCKRLKKICQLEEPLLQKINEHHKVRCWALD